MFYNLFVRFVFCALVNTSATIKLGGKWARQITETVIHSFIFTHVNILHWAP